MNLVVFFEQTIHPDVKEPKNGLFVRVGLGQSDDEADEKKKNVVLKDGYLDLDDFASFPGEIIHSYGDLGSEDLNYVNEYLAGDDDHDGNGMFKELTETGETADDGMVYFDSDECLDFPSSSSSSETNNFLDSTVGTDGLDLMDELMAYFGATENLKPSYLDTGSGPSSSFNPSCPAPAVSKS